MTEPNAKAREMPGTTETTADNRNYSRGYQAALRDTKDKLEQGGEEAVREWVQNNLAS